MSWGFNLKWVLLLAILAYGAMAGVFESRNLQGTCCSSCYESSIPYNRLYVTRFQSYALIFLTRNYPTSSFAQLLSRMPRKFSTELYQRLV